ncbi:hypothetical protein ACFQ48_17075 [Hymenobacter caeli]|uniref:LemA family protein n=1 Tax=Hymenobacter caeli TaxID=2735894 RepID=A0ABX2FQI9_9BACT|nr:hypothetical protein [Hymenobacter caeli]NRT19420.1 hypothetical protein [Hymenobacter caeli]
MPRLLRSAFPLKSVLSGLLLVVACAASCKRDGGTRAAAADPASATAVQSQLTVLRDSADAKWRTMVASDDQKIGLTRLLLRELAQQPGFDKARLEALGTANARLKARRYTQTALPSAQIDAYDAAQDSLLHVLLPLAAPGGAAPTDNARNFVEGLQQLDAGVVGYRVQYDRAAKQYNTYLALHQADVAHFGGKYPVPQPLPLFTIQ